MNREELVRMARESYLDVYGLGKDYTKFADALERFASLVAIAERGACAKVCDDLEPDNRHEGAWIAGWCDGTVDCAAAIRARGETK